MAKSVTFKSSFSGGLGAVYEGGQTYSLDDDVADALIAAGAAVEETESSFEAGQTADIGALEAADTAAIGRLDALEAADTASDGRLDAVEAADTAAIGRLDALEADVADHEARIVALETP